MCAFASRSFDNTRTGSFSFPQSSTTRSAAFLDRWKENSTKKIHFRCRNFARNNSNLHLDRTKTVLDLLLRKSYPRFPLFIFFRELLSVCISDEHTASETRSPIAFSYLHPVVRCQHFSSGIFADCHCTTSQLVKLNKCC